MAGFYYYFPNRSPAELVQGEELNHNFLAEFGLSEVLADVRRIPLHGHVGPVNSNAGPGKTCGVVLTVNGKYAGPPPKTGNWPDLQTWKPLRADKTAWIGVMKNELPRPEDLERLDIVFGPKVKDEGHYEWRVPCARAVHHGMPYGNLPQSYRFNDEGEPLPVLNSRWEWLWQLSGEIVDFYRAETTDQRKPEAWLVKQAARLLAVNYRLGLAELNFLFDLGRPVLQKDQVHLIAQASYGFEVLEEVKKKSPDEETAPTAAS